ncbi:MAG TPA: hypothetical protein VGD42_23235 [Lysobacter sp.]
MRNRCQFLWLCLLAGCATQPRLADADTAARSGQVGMRDISGAIAQPSRVALADNESFLVPIEDDANASPVYPDALLARQLPPQAVCLRVGIDRDGTVLSSVPVMQAPECPAPGEVDAAFFDAVSRVVAAWRYDPALRCIFPDAKTKDDTVGSCGGYTEVPEAVSLTYRFVFEQKDGRGVVRMAK